jgi:hypothetical protein
VLFASEKEAFGLSAIEALAVRRARARDAGRHHPVALQGVEGAYCAPFDRDA